MKVSFVCGNSSSRDKTLSKKICQRVSYLICWPNLFTKRWLILIDCVYKTYFIFGPCSVACFFFLEGPFRLFSENRLKYWKVDFFDWQSTYRSSRLWRTCKIRRSSGPFPTYIVDKDEFEKGSIDKKHWEPVPYIHRGQIGDNWQGWSESVAIYKQTRNKKIYPY